MAMGKHIFADGVRPRTMMVRVAGIVAANGVGGRLGAPGCVTAVALVAVTAGCGSQNHTRTVTVTTSTTATASQTSVATQKPVEPSTNGSISQSSATSMTSSACPAGEFDPYGPQGGCYTTPDPSRTTNPVSCPAGKEASDGGCATPSEINGTPTTSAPASSVQCNPNGLRKSVGFGQTGQPVCFGPSGAYADPWYADPTNAPCRTGYMSGYDQPLGESVCMVIPTPSQQP